jgi:hypothetical protein
MVTAITYKTKNKKTEVIEDCCPYGYVDRYQCFGGTWRLHLQNARERKVKKVVPVLD